MERKTIGIGTTPNTMSFPPGIERLPVDVREGIQCFLVLLKSHSDPRRALDAALKALVNLGVSPAAANTDGAEVSHPAITVSAPATTTQGPVTSGATKMEEDGFPSSPVMAYSLEAYPKCKSLVEHYRRTDPAKQKNPLSILNEYANKCSLEVTFEAKESELPGYCVEAKLTSTGGDILYGRGVGQGRGKKDARQLAGAAVLEIVLESVPLSDFISKGKAKRENKGSKPKNGAASGEGGAANEAEEMEDAVHDAGEPNTEEAQVQAGTGALPGFVKQTEPDTFTGNKRDLEEAQQTDEAGPAPGAGQGPPAGKRGRRARGGKKVKKLPAPAQANGAEEMGDQQMEA